MLLNKAEFNHPGTLAMRAPLEAYDPELETWQDLFTRRYPDHAGVLDALGKVQSVNEPVYIKVARSDSGGGIFSGLFPSLRCSP